MEDSLVQKIYWMVFYSNEIFIKRPLFGWEMLTYSKESRAFLYNTLCGNQQVGFHITNCGWREFGQHIKQSIKQRLICHRFTK